MVSNIVCQVCTVVVLACILRHAIVPQPLNLHIHVPQDFQRKEQRVHGRLTGPFLFCEGGGIARLELMKEERISIAAAVDIPKDDLNGY